MCWTTCNVIVLLSINRPDGNHMNSQRDDIVIRLIKVFKWCRLSSFTGSRFHCKAPPLNSVINPLTSSHLLSYLQTTNCSSRHKKNPLTSTVMLFSSGNSLFPFAHSLPYLLVSFLPLWNWLCPSSLCWCCSDRKTHPPSAELSLSLSLPDSHWLPVRGDITLLLCLPPPVFPPSLCGFWPLF